MTVLASGSIRDPLTLLLFGPMQAHIHERPLPPLRSRKGLWLLALLILRHDRPVEREWLAGTLWPDTDPSRAATNLRVNLSELRRALGEQGKRLQSPSRHTLALDLAGAKVDVVTFDAAMKSQKPEALKQAVALYRGPLLEDCAEEWIGQERLVREQECLRALQRLGDAVLVAGDYVAAKDYYQQAVRLDPWSEAARRGWMEALAKSGDHNTALQVYREFVELLRSDPKAVPDEETSALYTHLRAGARSNASPQPGPPVVLQATIPSGRDNLPHFLTDLIGRKEERNEVAAKLRGARLVTLTGPGGIGKTRLAIEVAREIAEEGAACPDGVWFVSLESLTEGKRIVPQIASVLGLQEETGHSLLESLTRHLQQKRLLLVLDNCEHLLEASAQAIAHLLRECARVRVLATSREALGILGETTWQVPSLAAPDPKHFTEDDATLLSALQTYESVQLFVKRAGECQKNFALTHGNALAIAQICFQLEGIPLAVELAAARIRALTVEQIAAHLNDRLGLLTVGNRSAQLRQQTLRTTLDWSYALLLDAECVLLERLSVFVGGWTLEAAEQVGSGKSIETGQVLNLLTSLVDKSLVVFEEKEESDRGRYRLLEMLRQYAQEKLQVRGEEEQVKTRHRDWSLLLVEEAAQHLRGGDQKYWLQRLDREYDNLRAVLAWSKADRHGAEAELRLTGALWRFWYIRGNYSEGRQYLRNALEREDAQERTMARAQALNGAGALAYDQGDALVARTFLEESLSISRQWEDAQGIASVLGNLANVALALGEIDSSRALYEESLVIQRKLDNRAGIALQLSNLGIVLRQQGDYAAAKNCFAESLEIARAIDDRIGAARALLNMGNVAWNQDDPVLERTCIEESLKLFRELGDTQGIARALGNLGKALNRIGEWQQARTCIEESLKLFQDLGDGRGIAQAYGNLGDVVCNQSDYVSARALYQESLSLFQTLQGNRGGVESLEGLAVALLMQSKTPKAVQLWAAGQKQRQTLGVPLPDSKEKARKHHLEQARLALGQSAFSIAWEEGNALSWEQAVASALSVEPGTG